MKVFNYIVPLLAFCFGFSMLLAQEHKGPLYYNSNINTCGHANLAAKKTSLALPFFDDFTINSIYPDTNKWTDHQAFVNNTMGKNPITRGVATLDALNEIGQPWDPYHNTVVRFSDSLTSRPLDLSSYSPADSLYLSFYFQPQGNGFYPLTGDSLFVFMRIRYGDWLPVWKVQGTSVKPFTQVMIPITDTLMYYNGFQFRFVNLAAMHYSDAVWNVDYIKLDAHRNINDTVITEVAYTDQPGSILNDYTSMPYRQFLAAPGAERAGTVSSTIRNNSTTQPITRNFTAKDVASGTVLLSPVTGTATLPDYSINNFTNSVYSSTVGSTGLFDKVVFENKFYIESTTGTGTTANDTIVSQQVFDNYLSYDDGSAEQSYYLTLFPTLPGKLAIEHHLNIPDTMKGMAIYFGRQVPFPGYKQFDIVVYSSLAGVNGASTDNIIYTQFTCSPGYADTVNHFWVYKFDDPVALPAGTFYTGVFMPAESGDDSLYFGLDVNRIGGNHVYYNVLSYWSPSTIHGAVMMRPLLGQNIVSSSVKDVSIADTHSTGFFPNPATTSIAFTLSAAHNALWKIADLTGRVLLEGEAMNGSIADITELKPGLYLVTLQAENGTIETQKLIKQ